MGEEKEPESYATMALGLSVTEWSGLGLDNDEDADFFDKRLMSSLVQRCTALLLVRIVAVCVKRKEDAEADALGEHPSEYESVFNDLSTSTICRTALMAGKEWCDYVPAITKELIDQLEEYVRIILSGYNDTPYHCNEHAFHVLLSVNKLVDLMLQTPSSQVKTFGLRNDPVAHLALVFSALIHDVEHKGVPNRQLTLEHDPLAVLYNDQSIAEQRSLHIGFSTLLHPEYKELRQAMFGLQGDEADSDSYWYFRKTVINLVLNTDIASPDRTQLAKSKFKEAFGDTFESMERKLKLQIGGDIDEDDEISLSDSVSEEGATDPSELSDEEEFALNTERAKKTSADSRSSLNGSGGSMRISKGSTRSLKVDPLKNTAKIDYGYQNLMSPGSGHSRKILRVNSVACCSRRQSVDLLQTDQAFAARFQRRLSSMSNQSNNPVAAANTTVRKRLGIRRTMDLSGESLEAYSHHNSRNRFLSMDEPDELKAAVVMELIMTAADVAHNLQGWDQVRNAKTNSSTCNFGSFVF